MLSADRSSERPRIAMLVWNGFVNDARVLREARTLRDAGAQLRVVAVLTPAREVAHEVLEPGIEVCRVRRSYGIVGRLVMLPRLLLRRILVKVGLRGPTLTHTPPGPWAFDRRLSHLIGEWSINRGMFRLVRAFEPDVVHSHDVNTLYPGWRAARRSGARLIYDAHEISADREGYHGRIWLIRLLERWIGRWADGRITTTGVRADWFREAYGWPDVVVLQNRPERCVVEGSTRIREALDLPADRLIVLYQGGLQWGRGLRNLLQAMRGLPQADLVFVGDGVQRASLESEASDLKGRVHFVGAVPLSELPEWTASADIGVQCLRNTCFNHYSTDSNKLFEYIMAGLPVVASDFPEIRAVVEQAECGLLVDPHDPKAVEGALRRLLEDAALRQRFAEQSRQVRQSLDWQSQSGALLSLYQRVLPAAAWKNRDEVSI